MEKIVKCENCGGVIESWEWSYALGNGRFVHYEEFESPRDIWEWWANVKNEKERDA